MPCNLCFPGSRRSMILKQKTEILDGSTARTACLHRHAELKMSMWAGAAITAFLALIFLSFFGLFEAANASLFQETYVYPKKAGQRKVQWRLFDWNYIDYPEDEEEKGGIRFYYYDSESEVVKPAVMALYEIYDEFKDLFNVVPLRFVPFFLYSSHLEFEQTNIFRISEGVLGVTSPSNLKLSLPYYGQFSRYREICAHEMVHVFTIIKADQIAHKTGTKQSPLYKLPLWFIEGMAEFYSKRGLDAETLMYIRDIVYHENPKKNHELPDFFDEGPYDFVRIYKLGQAQLAFMTEKYGANFPQLLLEKSYLLQPHYKAEEDEDAPAEDERKNSEEKGYAASTSSEGESDTDDKGSRNQKDKAEEESSPASLDRYGRMLNFVELMEYLTGQDKKEINEAWKRWIGNQFPLPPPRTIEASSLDIQTVKTSGEYIDSYSVDESGDYLMYRSAEKDTGIVTLFLIDANDHDDPLAVAVDRQPGFESLHFMQRKVFTVKGNQTAFAVLDHGRDVLHVRNIVREDNGNLRTGSSKREFRFPEIVEIGTPVFSPEGDRLAFTGLTEKGYEDLFWIDLKEKKPELRRLTEDLYSDIDPDWGDDGILFSSDRTENGNYNLFLVNPGSGKIRQVTEGDYDYKEGRFVQNDGYVYSSYVGGKSDLYLLKDQKEKQLTDTLTGYFMPSLAGEYLYFIRYFEGRYQLQRIKKRFFPEFDTQPDDQTREIPSKKDLYTKRFGRSVFGYESKFKIYDLLNNPSDIQASFNGYSSAVANPLDFSREYTAFRWKSWELDWLSAVFGSGDVGGASMIFSDIFKNHMISANMMVYGDVSLSDAIVRYQNIKSRFQWGTALYHIVQTKLDKTFPDWEDNINYYRERRFGMQGFLSYAFSRFFHIEGAVDLGGVDRFDYTEIFEKRADAWREKNAGLETAADFGIKIGIDTTRRHFGTGPVQGFSWLITYDISTLPDRGVSTTAFRSEFIHYQRVFKGMNFMTRLGAGTSAGGRFAAQYYISSFDNHRAFEWNDSYLLGDNFILFNEELQFPLSPTFHNFPISYVEGVLGFDAASIFDERRLDEIKAQRTAGIVTGVNVVMGPFVFRLHYGRHVDIGGELNDTRDFDYSDWTSNFSIRYALY